MDTRNNFSQSACEKTHESPLKGLSELNKVQLILCSHFRQCVLDRKVIVEKICTTHQRADIFAKALPRDAFRYLQSAISGWQTFVRECHEHVIHDGIHKFPQQIVRVPAAPILPCARSWR